MTAEEIAGLREKLALGRMVVTIGGRSATTPEELDFILEAQKNTKAPEPPGETPAPILPPNVYANLADVQRLADQAAQIAGLEADIAALRAENQELLRTLTAGQPKAEGPAAGSKVKIGA